MYSVHYIAYKLENVQRIYFCFPGGTGPTAKVGLPSSSQSCIQCVGIKVQKYKCKNAILNKSISIFNRDAETCCGRNLYDLDN